MTYSYTAGDLEIFLRGHQSTEVGPLGLRPTRLGRLALDRVPVAAMRMMVDTSAGIRLQFRTKATVVRLTGTFWSIEIDGIPAWPVPAVDVTTQTGTTTFPVHSRARAVLRPEADHVDFSRPETSTISFDLAGGQQDVEVWLPHSAISDLEELCADWPLVPSEPSRPIWIHHGSSISHCLEAESPGQTWPALAARQLELDMHDLAFAGNALVEPFVARQIRDMEADFITLKLGINVVNADLMRLRAFRTAIEGFLDTVRDGHPQTPIVLISPIAFPAVETRPGPTGLGPDGKCASLAPRNPPPDALTLSRIRECLKAIVDRREGEDPALRYLDGRELFSDAHVRRNLMPDGLHPNGKGYAVMADNFVRAAQRWVRPVAGHSTLH